MTDVPALPDDVGWTARRRIFELDRPARLTLKEEAARGAGLAVLTDRAAVPVDLAVGAARGRVRAGPADRLDRRGAGHVPRPARA